MIGIRRTRISRGTGYCGHNEVQMTVTSLFTGPHKFHLHQENLWFDTKYFKMLNVYSFIYFFVLLISMFFFYSHKKWRSKHVNSFFSNLLNVFGISYCYPFISLLKPIMTQSFSTLCKMLRQADNQLKQNRPDLDLNVEWM